MLFRYTDDEPRTYQQIPATAHQGQVFTWPDPPADNPDWVPDFRWEQVPDPAGVDVTLPDNADPDPVAVFAPPSGDVPNGPIPIVVDENAPPAQPPPTTETPADTPAEQ